MTKPAAQTVDSEAPGQPELPADSSQFALGGLIDPGTPRADSHDPAPAEPVGPTVP